MVTTKTDEKKLFEYILNKLVKRIEEKEGLSIFANQRSKFEGWLKVELVDILKSKNKDVRIEYSIGKKKVDVFFDNYLIELKTVNTNYTYDDKVEKKIRAITDNIDGIINDICKIINKKNYKKAILFVVFPLSDEDKWKKHLNKIDKEIGNKKILIKKEIKFCFKNSEIPGKLYFYLFN
uniref:Uncharacterized protein n=1 Tax=candidate division WOR-3 bacterium TaxID=2052148 RepID=A0A7C3J5T5_UNCW3